MALVLVVLLVTVLNGMIMSVRTNPSSSIDDAALVKLYVGSRDFKPDGYLTVDIDPAMKPDIIADITNMNAVADRSADEVVAGHVLEHIDWPDSFLAFAEFARVLKPEGVLKIALPDMGCLLRMLLSGDSAFHVMGLVYGIGGRINRFEQHRYGFTPGMLVDILETLGFDQFDWWNSEFGDASNGWIPRYEGEHAGVSLNLQAVKRREPGVDTKALYQRLVERPLSDFLAVAAEVQIGGDKFHEDGQVAKLYQRIHFQLIDARQRIRHLEAELDAAARANSE
ncbi:class I SAM-dependent methyltransferase [Inquilinus sp. CA228]|uniref:class I SAM-dependent methyltransferase n=1 Tax=Inquilinus sp. CA228 TaxID=3455609 RepID=UPI003F8D8255